MLKRPHDQISGDGLAEQDDRHGREQRQWLFDHHPGIEKHPHRDEEQHREGVAQRQGFLGRPPAERRFSQDHPCEEGAKRKGYIEHHRGAECDPERDREHGEAEQLPRAGVRHPVECRRDHTAPDQQHEADKAGNLEQGDAERRGDRGYSTLGSAICGARQCREQYERQNHDEILDDQPSDRDAPAFGLDQVPGLERAQQNHRTCDR
jgi:hypothetical protein